MGQFLFIIPEGWISVPDAVIQPIQGGLPTFKSWVNSYQLPIITDELITVGFLQPNQQVIEAKVFDDELLVIKLAD